MKRLKLVWVLLVARWRAWLCEIRCYEIEAVMEGVPARHTLLDAWADAYSAWLDSIVAVEAAETALKRYDVRAAVGLK